MTHPDEIMLTGYVDRSLPDDERRAVAEHLASCEQCRHEVELAAHGRVMLASLPVVEAPPIGWPSGAEAGRPVAAQRSGPPRWYRALAGVAAAAALVVAVAVIVPNLGSPSADRAAAPGEAAASATSGAEGGKGVTAPVPQPSFDQPAFDVRQPTDYDRAGLDALARTLIGRSAAVAFAGTPRTTTSESLSCIGSSSPPDSRLRGIIEARFEGAPAWIAVYSHRSGGVHQIVVRALARDDCSLLEESQARG